MRRPRTLPVLALVAAGAMLTRATPASAIEGLLRLKVMGLDGQEAGRFVRNFVSRLALWRFVTELERELHGQAGTG